MERKTWVWTLNRKYYVIEKVENPFVLGLLLIVFKIKTHIQNLYKQTWKCGSSATTARSSQLRRPPNMFQIPFWFWQWAQRWFKTASPRALMPTWWSRFTKSFSSSVFPYLIFILLKKSNYSYKQVPFHDDVMNESYPSFEIIFFLMNYINQQKEVWCLFKLMSDDSIWKPSICCWM